MTERIKRRRWRPFLWLAGSAVLLATLAGVATAWVYIQNRASLREQYVTHAVHRADMFPTRLASGRVESGKRTVIECKLENLAVSVRGKALATSGASVLLSVVPEGSTVKRGDILAVLDSSNYEELLRVQRISMERVKADRLQAELEVQIAGLAVREFKEGKVVETNQNFEGKIFLAQSDLERAVDRLNWSRRMNAKGYVPAATVSSDSFRKEQAELALTQQGRAYDVFKKFTAPKTLRLLEGTLQAARAMLEYQELRSQNHTERLATLEKQVKNCTIRAPHDGFVIYANHVNREVLIEAGAPVRQSQQLFFLPDLNDMEVVASLNESIVDNVRSGMRATVHIEGLGNRRIEGRVISVATLATPNYRTDVKCFDGIVKLENAPSHLRPGMSAEVEIALPRVDDALTVPSNAILAENGHDYCFVVHEDGLEQREIRLGQVTSDFSEVTRGLEEGDEVVVNPPKDDSELQGLSPTELASEDPAPRTDSTHGAVAALR